MITSHQKDELRALLERDLEQNGRFVDEVLRNVDHWLDEDSGQFYVSQHKRTVFRLDSRQLPALQHAYAAFEDLQGAMEPANFEGTPIHELIVKARGALSCNLNETPEPDAFLKFAKEFYGISNRQAYGYYFKRRMNELAVTVFDDERSLRIDSERG